MRGVDRARGHGHGQRAARLLPGTHKLPFVRPADFGVEAKWENYPNYEEYVAERDRARGPGASYGTIKKGQAIVWAANLLHGGAHQETAPERASAR